jgi:hypothetical protein
MFVMESSSFVALVVLGTANKQKLKGGGKPRAASYAKTTLNPSVVNQILLPMFLRVWYSQSAA